MVTRVRVRVRVRPRSSLGTLACCICGLVGRAVRPRCKVKAQRIGIEQHAVERSWVRVRVRVRVMVSVRARVWARVWVRVRVDLGASGM